MPKIKLTKSVVDAAAPKDRDDYDLRNTVVPSFTLKVTPAGRKIFMLHHLTKSGTRRKPAIGHYGELTVDQARKIAQDWLADVRHGNDPSAERVVRAAPTMKELCDKFIDDYSKHHNKSSTVEANQLNIKNHILPHLGKLKVPDVTRADVSAVITAMSGRPTIANRTLSAQDVQPGGGLGLSPGRLKPMPAYQKVSRERQHAFRH